MENEKVAFITGHLDLTEEEFNLHYKNQIDDLISQGFSFVVGDARGCDVLSQRYLFDKNVQYIVFHMFSSPRNNPNASLTKGEYKSDDERDLAMHNYSSVTVGWARPGREKSGTAKNIARRMK